MPTTLIATTAGIGIGIMAQTMERNIDTIDSVIVCNYPSEFSNKISFNNVIGQFDLQDPRKILPLIDSLQKYSSRKFLTIETSWGLSSHINPDKLYYIPMWEQGSVPLECKNSNNVISITHKTKKVIRSIGKDSTYLPYPIEISKKLPNFRNKVTNILHNAGSLGGNLRKGTCEAIKIFQKSGMAREGKKLIIHSWKNPTDEISSLLSMDKEGIVWNNKFFEDYRDIYDEGDIDLLLFPSKLEGHAMVVLEAMSKGIPVLCTDIDPINEYEHDDLFKMPIERQLGNYSYVDCEKAAKKLIQICDMDLTKKSKSCYEYVTTNMSWSVLKDRYNELLK